MRCKGEAHGDEGCDAQLAHSVSAESTSVSVCGASSLMTVTGKCLNALKLEL